MQSGGYSRSGHAPAPDPDAGTAADLTPEHGRLLADNCVDVVFQSVDGVIRWVSPSITRMLGLQPEEVIGADPGKRVLPADREELVKARAELAAGHPTRLVLRVVAKGDRIVWVEAALRPFRTDDGRGGVVGALVDVSQRVVAEEQRAATQEQLAILSEHADDVVFVANPDHRVTWVSPSVTRVLGWTSEQILGSVTSDLMHPYDRAIVEPRLASSYAGHPVDESLGGQVLRMRTSHGAYRWMACTMSPRLDERGSPNGVIGSFQDVDDLVRARNAVTRDTRRLRKILDSLLDPHMLLRPVLDETGAVIDLQVEDVNHAGLDYLGVERSAFVGTRLLTVFPAVDEVGLIDSAQAVLASNQPLVLDNVAYDDAESHERPRRFDIRATQVEGLLSVVWRDVTERNDQMDALVESERRYRLLAANSTDAVVQLRDGRVIWAAPTLKEVLGWTPDEWADRRLEDFVHSDDVKAFGVMGDRVASGSQVVQRFRMRDESLVYHWVELHVRPYVDDMGRRDGEVVSFRIVDEEVSMHEELDRRARFDELTGLLNRKEALERISAMSGHVRRSGGQTAVLFVDVDRFKEVNDAFGHAVGDEVLRTAATRIARCVRAVDIAARVGGDEILVVLDGVHSVEDAVEIAQKIRLAIAMPIDAAGQFISATVSVGVTVAHPGEDVDALIRRADEAMYQAKTTGRNQVVSIS